MKLKCTMPLLFLVYSASAQLTVTPGAEFFMNGNIPVALNNTDLINNGIFAGGVNTVSFSGDASSSISGIGNLRFFQVEINKSADKSVFLQKKIDVVNRVLFLSGFLDLNGFDLDLETTGRIDFEHEDSRVTGANGGQVLLTTNLSSPVTANPGGLGLFITTNQNLGNVIIKRGHQSQVNGAGLGASILRYFDIVPENNVNLDATLGVNYFNGELNGFNKNFLEFWQSPDNVHWTDVGFSVREASNNFVNKTGIGSFSRFTLSTPNNPLPVRFISFDLSCEKNKVNLSWKTAQEVNNDHYEVERSADGITWSQIGKVPAAGNSSIEHSYQFVDNNPSTNSYYRIAEFDVDGKVQYTNILLSSCNVAERLTVSPNPVHEKMFVNLVVANQSNILLKLYDSEGRLVKAQQANVLKGSNNLFIDISPLSNGIYYLFVDLNNGKPNKTIQVLKQ